MISGFLVIFTIRPVVSYCETGDYVEPAGDSVDLPVDLKAHYRAKNIVPGWLSREFEETQLRSRAPDSGAA